MFNRQLPRRSKRMPLSRDDKVPSQFPASRGPASIKFRPGANARASGTIREKDVLLTNEASKLLKIKGRAQKTNPKRSHYEPREHDANLLKCKEMLWGQAEKSSVGNGFPAHSDPTSFR